MSRRLLPFLLLLLLACAACAEGGGAVVFAPTPLPPDESPAAYTHPSGVFTLEAPRRWAVSEQYTPELASVSFAPPGSDQPLLTISAVNTGEDLALDVFAGLLDRYQAEVRPDRDRYTEVERTPLGDGSWRIRGYRESPGGNEAVNTFILRDGPIFATADLTLPANPGLSAALEAAVNSLRLTPPGALQATSLSALSQVRTSVLSVVHSSAWTTADGVFYVTGEVTNSGPIALASVPVEVVLTTPDGTSLQGAVDSLMGHALPPGGFAPFSMRFGGGQPEAARRVVVRVGGGDWTPEPALPVLGAGSLAWTDETSYQDDGALVVGGEVMNTSNAVARQVRAVVTVFDAAQQVIGAASAELAPSVLAPGERAAYRFVFSDLGGAPAQYVVNVQALP